MTRFIIVCLGNGLLFGILDGMLNANPLAQKLYAVYKPISKTTINVPAGIIIDLSYGFIMGALFLLLYTTLPGSSGLQKGFSYALIVWFFRVVMSVASTWMMFKVPVGALAYTALGGLIEMMIIGLMYGLFLKPAI